METKSSAVFGGCLVFGIALASAADLRVLVYDYADLPPGVLQRAQEEASRIYRRAGVRTHWTRCRGSGVEAPPPACAPPRHPGAVELRVLPRRMAQGFRLAPAASGLTLLSLEDGSGVLANVFWHRAAAIARRKQLSHGIVLGHIIAHELGHMLLGPAAHAATGLMTACWGSEELAAASRGALLFNDAEGARIRARLPRLPAPPG